jgi:hypothetical protein
MAWTTNVDEAEALRLFKAWFVKPMEKMDIDGGFVAFMVALALYERLIVAKLVLEHGRADEDAQKQKKAEDLGLTDREQSIFWDLFRNGLLHEGMPLLGKTGFILDPDFTDKPKLKYYEGKPVFCIDPWKFYHRVINEFLNDPRLITTSDSFPLAMVGEIDLDDLADTPPEAQPSPVAQLLSFPSVVTGIIKTDQTSSDGDPLA